MREDEIKRLLMAIEAAVEANQLETEVASVATGIFSALGSLGVSGEGPGEGELPVLKHLDIAIDAAETGPAPIPELAQAFSAVSRRLRWWQRAVEELPQFVHGHANAEIIGPGGLEVRSDVTVGVTLMAPGITYPDHRHLPAEIYVVMSEGEWRKDDGPWYEPGVGSLIYNSPNIVHAMRSGEKPLLAIWCLLSP